MLERRERISFRISSVLSKADSGVGLFLLEPDFLKSLGSGLLLRGSLVAKLRQFKKNNISKFFTIFTQIGRTNRYTLKKNQNNFTLLF